MDKPTDRQTILKRCEEAAGPAVPYPPVDVRDLISSGPTAINDRLYSIEDHRG